MVRLHLIGFTTDLKNLIFATRRTAKRGGFILEIDKRLLGALEEVARLEANGETPPGDEQLVRPAQAVAEAPVVRSSALSPKEIQALLRQGKSEEQVAKLAETDVSWIRRFTGPIIAERAGVIDSVRAGLVSKPRLGPSSVNVGLAVQQNLFDKRIQMDPESFERSWKATRRGGRWQVVFQYVSRGKRRAARFSFDPESRKVTAANDVALEVGWRPAGSRKPRRVSTPANSRRGSAGNEGASGKLAKRPAKKKPAPKKRSGSLGRKPAASSAHRAVAASSRKSRPRGG